MELSMRKQKLEYYDETFNLFYVPYGKCGWIVLKRRPGLFYITFDVCFNPSKIK